MERRRREGRAGRKEARWPYLFEGALGPQQVVDHVGGDADEGGDPDAVAQHVGPRRVLVVKQPHLGREGQETNDDELEDGRGRTHKRGFYTHKQWLGCQAILQD